MNSLAAQVFAFFLAGFETSSTTMTFCLYELSVNPEIQERLRTEIDTVLEKHDGILSYEAVQEMTYLDKVISGRAKGTTLFPTVVCVSYYRLVLERFTSVSLSHSEVMSTDCTTSNRFTRCQLKLFSPPPRPAYCLMDMGPKILFPVKNSAGIGSSWHNRNSEMIGFQRMHCSSAEEGWNWIISYLCNEWISKIRKRF
jgi:hypothetical protein